MKTLVSDSNPAMPSQLWLGHDFGGFLANRDRKTFFSFFVMAF
ncbi:hypothetical protein ACFL2H_04475 [Planctomycetota bacterium]